MCGLLFVRASLFEVYFLGLVVIGRGLCGRFLKRNRLSVGCPYNPFCLNLSTSRMRESAINNYVRERLGGSVG